jgi:hypothetical protein
MPTTNPRKTKIELLSIHLTCRFSVQVRSPATRPVWPSQAWPDTSDKKTRCEQRVEKPWKNWSDQKS